MPDQNGDKSREIFKEAVKEGIRESKDAIKEAIAGLGPMLRKLSKNGWTNGSLSSGSGRWGRFVF